MLPRVHQGVVGEHQQDEHTATPARPRRSGSQRPSAKIDTAQIITGTDGSYSWGPIHGMASNTAVDKVANSSGLRRRQTSSTHAATSISTPQPQPRGRRRASFGGAQDSQASGQRSGRDGPAPQPGHGPRLFRLMIAR
jgi:hypothetical protein